MQKLLIPGFLCLVLLLGAWPQAALAQDCAPPKITANAKIYNIFSSEQEMVLGELTYQRLAGEMHFVRDPQLLAYLNGIGEKLIKHLPSTGLKIQFFIVDIPDANAFDVPGGYIFISRKLIGFTNNEDELAGVMAHELGHAVVRHGASDFSELLKKVLNVTQVGDRKDIAEKYNLLIEKRNTKSASQKSGEESEQQLEADRIGLFAMVAAGYDPSSFASFFGRLVETKAKSGNWFSDIFGKPKPEEKRLREMIKITEQLPAQCRESAGANASQEFLAWQAGVVSNRDRNQTESLSALIWKKELTPKLRSDISHFAFSSDGKYFLAQDDFAITVMQREPLSVLFQIPAPEAHDASFTPDGKFVVFGTKNLRYEKWSVADHTPVQVRELVVRRDCWEHGFSPDGNYLVCFDYDLNLNIVDTQTGKKIWEKKDFYRLTFFELFFWIASAGRDDASIADRFFHVEFSPDSHFLAVARTNKFRFRIRVDAMVADETDDTLLALDMGTMKPVHVGGDLKKVTTRPFIFLDSGKILGTAAKTADSGIFSFPEGKRLAKFPFGAEVIQRTANPDYLIVKPIAGAKMGMFNVAENSLVSGSDKVDAAIWDKFVVYESVSGEVLLSEFSHEAGKKGLQMRPVGKIEIPVASIGDLSAADVSDNLHWLAASSKTRGAVWNLESGERKLFVRGFRGAVLANNGAGIAEFPKNTTINHSLAVLDPFNNEARSILEVPERGARQYGRFLLTRTSLKDPKPTEKDKSTQSQDDPSTNASLNREVRFELQNLIDSKLVYSRDFHKDAPQFFFDSFSGRLIFYWTLGSEVGKARLKEDPELAARAKALGNKDDDYLMEVIDCFAGKTVGTLLLETGKGSFSIESGFSEGDWLVLHDSNNRVLVYSIKDGDLRHRFFGSTAAIDLPKNQIAVENYPGELTFYDLSTGDSQTRLTFATAAAFLRFSLDGKKLFVLSGEQTAYAFDMDKLLARSSAAP